MKAKEFMTPNPVCCTADTPIREAARLMVEHHIGALPVVTSHHRRILIGIVTDRDLACRGVAQDKDAHSTVVRDCMSSPVATVTPETSLESCCKVMEADRIRRLPVVNSSRQIEGIIAQADISRVAPEHETAELVRDISEPTASPSRVPIAA